jgi:hypothetical protein
MAKTRLPARARADELIRIEVPLIDLAQWTIWADDLLNKLKGSKLEEDARRLWMSLMAPLPAEGYMLMDALVARPDYLRQAHHKSRKPTT